MDVPCLGGPVRVMGAQGRAQSAEASIASRGLVPIVLGACQTCGLGRGVGPGFETGEARPDVPHEPASGLRDPGAFAETQAR